MGGVVGRGNRKSRKSRRPRGLEEGRRGIGRCSSFLLHEQKKRSKENSSAVCRALPKIIVARPAATAQLATLRQYLRFSQYSLHF